MNKLPVMVYVGPSMISRTRGYEYRIRSVTHVGVKTIYEFYDNQGRLKNSEHFISADKYNNETALVITHYNESEVWFSSAPKNPIKGLR